MRLVTPETQTHWYRLVPGPVPFDGKGTQLCYLHIPFERVAFDDQLNIDIAGVGAKGGLIIERQAIAFQLDVMSRRLVAWLD